MQKIVYCHISFGKEYKELVCVTWGGMFYAVDTVGFRRDTYLFISCDFDNVSNRKRAGDKVCVGLLLFINFAAEMVYWHLETKLGLGAIFVVLESVPKKQICYTMFFFM